MDQVAKTALVAFAKNPVLEKFKTRLFDDIQSSRRVEKTYELLLKITDQALTDFQSTGRNVKSFWAMNTAPENLPRYFSAQVQLMAQGVGPLGERLHTVYQELKKSNHQVIVIGSDLPFLSEELLQLTLEKLKIHDVVVGPSDDGGFYLFASKLDLDKNFWTRVEYSKNTTLEQLIGPLKDIQISTLPTLTDIDDLASYTKAIKILKNTTGLSQFQNELLAYYESEIKPVSESFLSNQRDLFYQRRTV